MLIFGKLSADVRRVRIGALIVLLLLPFFHAAAENGSVRILNYHTFMGSKNAYSFSLEELKTQCEELMAEGFTFIAFDDFKKGAFHGSKNILLTIDDGHRTGYDACKKVLLPLGIKPLLAVYPAVIGKKKFALTWEQLKELLDDGCSVASHGYHHNFCDEAAMKKDAQSVEKEIVKSKAVLEEKLGRRIETFVYPFGVYSNSTIEALKKAGYSYGMTIKGGSAFIGGSMADYELPRYILTRSKTSRLSGLFGPSKKNDTDKKNAAIAKKSDTPKLTNTKGKKTRKGVPVTTNTEGKKIPEVMPVASNTKGKKIPDGVPVASNAEGKKIPDGAPANAHLVEEPADILYTYPSGGLSLYGAAEDDVRPLESASVYSGNNINNINNENSVHIENEHHAEANIENFIPPLPHEASRTGGIKEKIYSLINTTYNAGVEFISGVNKRIAGIGSRIYDFFANMKIFES
ncbi:MAG: polysaccharide deacetylase family protein [Spirochaetia bacterium]|jgi:peptidoglycan/xylan/chitin deacetylase (PgdA/CDA1 family)|nr:polysaccharide deacetylase family protein [Spirochaetia bacterium]